MIKIEINDSIIDVVNKINNCEDDEIILSFPLWHQILHNYMSLKILKSKAWKKRLTISTSDIVSKKIWTSLWIKYTFIKDWEIIKKTSARQEILKKNYTFFGYFIYVIRQYLIKFYKIFFAEKSSTIKYKNFIDSSRKSGVLFLIISLLVSVGMLGFIFYFAVSKTYVEILPEVNIKTQGINMTFTENKELTESLRNDFIIPLTPLSKIVNFSYSHNATWIDYTQTKLASWEVTFINEMKIEYSFRPKTRVLSEEWIVYETTDWIKIPGATVDEKWKTTFWKVTTNVQAQTFDSKWVFSGTRANLKEWILTIPWLKFNQDKVYAKITKPMSWWEDQLVSMIDEKDIENAKNMFEERIKDFSLNELKDEIVNKNAQSGIKYEILAIDNIIEYNNLNISNVEEITPGEKVDNFTLNWNIEIKTYIYNKNLVLNLFSKLINNSLLKWTDKLMFIDDNSLRVIEVVDKKEWPLTVKSTLEIDAWITFDFDNNSNFYNQKLKQTILWLSNKEAKNILLNEKNIANVFIKNTPFFTNYVSGNIDNIILKIKHN